MLISDLTKRPVAQINASQLATDETQNLQRTPGHFDTFSKPGPSQGAPTRHQPTADLPTASAIESRHVPMQPPVDPRQQAISQYQAIQQDIADDSGDIDDLRTVLMNCAEQLHTLQCADELRVALHAMLRLEQRCENESRPETALSLCDEAQRHLPDRSENSEDRRIRGWSLQRQGKLIGGREGIELLRQSLSYLDDACDRGLSFLFIGNLWQTVAEATADTAIELESLQTAIGAFEDAFSAYQRAGNGIKQARMIIAWAEPALRLKPTKQVRQRLDVAIEVFNRCYAQVFAQASLTFPTDMPLVNQLEQAAELLKQQSNSELQKTFLYLAESHAAAQLQLGKTHLHERAYLRAQKIFGDAYLLARIAAHAPIQSCCLDVLRQLEQRKS